MAKLNREDVLKLAQLARLDITEAEIVEYQDELSKILAYVEKLQNVDTNNLQPTNQVGGLINISRDDEVKDYGYAAKDLLNNVPAVKDDQIQVPRMVD